MIAPFVHGGAIADAVYRLKYRGRREVAGELGALLVVPAVALDLRPDVIVPVPLHAQRRRERGYDQAELLARAVSRRLGVPCRPRLLERLRSTSPQVGAGRSERRENLRGAFRALACPGRSVLLVDDVVTTGATAAAAASALREAGAQSVTVLALARAG